jgi:hypothetical protein
MTGVSGIPSAGTSLQTTWRHISQRVDELAAQVTSGDVETPSFAQAIVEFNSLRLQAGVSGAIYRTQNELTEALLLRPRR